MRPVRKAIVLKNSIMTPCKPNSAKRQVVQVVIPRYGFKMFAYVPYKKYPLQKWNRVWITSHWGSDVSKVKCRCIRGKLDLPSPDNVGGQYPRSKMGLGPKRPSRLKLDTQMTKYVVPKAEE